MNKIQLHNIEGKVRRSEKEVILELCITDKAILELHFGDPDQLMSFFVMGIEEMAKVFPEHEASKLWLDDTFK